MKVFRGIAEKFPGFPNGGDLFPFDIQFNGFRIFSLIDQVHIQCLRPRINTGESQYLPGTVSPDHLSSKEIPPDAQCPARGIKVPVLIQCIVVQAPGLVLDPPGVPEAGELVENAREANSKANELPEYVKGEINYDKLNLKLGKIYSSFGNPHAVSEKLKEKVEK